MDKRQEEKFEKFLTKECGPGKKGAFYGGLLRKAWNACLDANGIEDEKKSWQANRDDPINRKGEVPYGGLNAPTLIDLMREISASVKDIAKKLEPEVVNVEAKKPVWKDRELMDFLEMAQGFIQTEKIRATFGIPQEAKEWTPNNGDAVFLFTGHENKVPVGRFEGYSELGFHQVVTPSGEYANVSKSCIKPFNPSAIGKPWSEI